MVLHFKVRGSSIVKIKIIINGIIQLDAVLYETKTAQKIYEDLPISGNGNTWGEEIYFSSNVEERLENPKEVLEAGDVAYWPPMQAICLFYGPTPASHGDEIRAAGPVNVVGKIKGDFKALKDLKDPLKIIMEKA